MREFCGYWWQCICIGARGNTAFANDWQWLFGIPAVLGLMGAFTSWVTQVSATHPILHGVLTALGAFVVTWMISFVYRVLNAPVAREAELAKRNAELQDQLQEMADAAKPNLELYFGKAGMPDQRAVGMMIRNLSTATLNKLEVMISNIKRPDRSLVQNVTRFLRPVDGANLTMTESGTAAS